MLRSNNAFRKHLILFIRERKNLQSDGNDYLQNICRAVVKKLTNYEDLALSKTKKQTQAASGLY